jgi:hypothetical protein
MSSKKRQRVKVTRQNRLKSLKEKYDDFCELLALAEAGALDYAHRLAIARKPRRILVLGSEEGFSKATAEYALEFAQRMSYEIVALNLKSYLHTLSKPVVKIEQFIEEASSRNVPVIHIIRDGQLEDCLKSVEKEVGSIELVISDPVLCNEVDCVKIGQFIPFITVVTESS